MSIAFVVESLDDGVHSIEQLEIITALPSLAVIPSDAPLIASRPATIEAVRLWNSLDVVTVLRPHSDTAEAYRALRTAILLSPDARFVKVLMITSALPQEGKTTTSINLAVVLAQQDARVLLIEGDMRRAGICRALNIKAERGLNEVLAGNVSAQAVIQNVPGIANLWVLPAGPTALYPSEMLGSARMKDLLTSLRDQFDHIIIDTPPALAVTDAVMLSAIADATLLIARSGTTSKAALHRVRDILTQVDARLIGVVLNAMDSTQFGREYYGTKYQKGYYSE
jgi:succinoglycan biosynthesis transport protein ExoP